MHQWHGKETGSQLVRGRTGPRAGTRRFSRIRSFPIRSQQGGGVVFRTQTADGAQQIEASSTAARSRTVPAGSDRTKSKENGAFLQDLHSETRSSRGLIDGRDLNPTTCSPQLNPSIAFQHLLRQ